jgi:hypothetical protein
MSLPSISPRRAVLHAALALLATSMPLALRAQVAVDVQLSAGAALPTGFLRDVAGPGPAAQVAFSGSIPYTPLAIRGALLGVRLPGRGSTVDGTSMAAFGVDLVYKFAVAGVRPYVLLGPAFYLARFDRRAASASDPFPDVGNVSFFRGGFSAGGGMQAGHGRTRGFVEASYHALRLENADAEIVRPQFVAVTAGVQIDLKQGRVPHKGP